MAVPYRGSGVGDLVDVKRTAAPGILQDCTVQWPVNRGHNTVLCPIVERPRCGESEALEGGPTCAFGFLQYLFQFYSLSRLTSSSTQHYLLPTDLELLKGAPLLAWHVPGGIQHLQRTKKEEKGGAWRGQEGAGVGGCTDCCSCTLPWQHNRVS